MDSTPRDLDAEIKEAELRKNADLETHLQRIRHPRSDADAFFESAKDAISAIAAGDVEHKVRMPGGRVVSALSVVQGLELDPFVDCDDEL